MARVAMAQQTAELRDRRKHGVENFRVVTDGVNALSRMQMTGPELARLGEQVACRAD